MEIRPAFESDIPTLLALLDQVGEVHHRIRPDIFRAGARKYDREALAELLEAENRIIYVAEEGGKVLGYCFCQFVRHHRDSVMTDRRELYIDDLCVDENCRGMGVGKALYDHVCGWAKVQGFNFVTLNVWSGNDSAMAFYESRGMKPRKIYMEYALEEDHAD